MANMYDKPQDLKFINTYVSPNFGAMLKAGSAIQARADAAEEGQAAIEDAFSSIKALKWAEEDVKKRDNIISGYQDRIDKEIERVGGDYFKALPFMKKLHKEVKKDLTIGTAAQLNANYATWNADYEEQDALQETNKITTDAFENRQQRLRQAYIDQGGVGEKGDLHGIQGMNAIQTPGDLAADTMAMAGQIKQMNRTQLGRWITNNNLGSGEVKTRKTVSTEDLSSEKIERLTAEYMSKNPKYESYFKQIADDKKWKYKGQLESVGVNTWTEERIKYGGGFTEGELKYFKDNNLTEEAIENYSERKWYNETKYNDVNELAATAGDMKEVHNRKVTETNWTDQAMVARKKAAIEATALKEANMNLGESLSLKTPKENFKKRVEAYEESKAKLPGQKANIAENIKNLDLIDVDGATNNPFVNAVKNLFGGASWGATVQEFEQDTETRRKQEENNIQEFSDQMTGNVETKEYSNWKAENAEGIKGSSEEDIANYYYQIMGKNKVTNEDGSPKRPYEMDNRTGAPLSNKRALIDAYMEKNGVSENEAKDVIGGIEKEVEIYRSQLANVKVTDAKLSGIKGRVMEGFTPSDWNTAYTEYTSNLTKYNNFSKNKTLSTEEYGEVIPMSKEEFKDILINSNSKEEIDDAINRSFNKADNKAGTYNPSALESWAINSFSSGNAQEGSQVTGLESGQKSWKAQATASLHGLWDKAQDGIALADNNIATHYGLISSAWEKGTPATYLKNVFNPNDDIKNKEIINEAGETTTLLELWPDLEGVPESKVEIITDFTPNIGNASYVTHVYNKDGEQIGEGRLLHLPWKDEEINDEMNKLRNSDRPTLRANANAYFGFQGMPNISVDDLTLMHSDESLPLHISNHEVGRIEKFGVEVGFPAGGWAIVGVDPSTGESQVISKVESALDVGEAVEGLKSGIPSR
jgi:hypothetical protein